MAETEILKAIERAWQRPHSYRLEAGKGVMPKHIQHEVHYCRTYVYNVFNALVRQGKLQKAPKRGHGYYPVSQAVTNRGLAA